MVATLAPKPAPQSFTKSPLVDSTALLADRVALQKRADEEGYLYFKKFLPAEYVMDLRGDILEVMDKYRWRLPGQGRLGGLIDTAVVDAIPEVEITSWGCGDACYRDVQKLQSFHRFPHHPKLLALYRSLFGSEVLVHPRNIARMILPHPANFPTPQHQDFPHIQGTANTWTCWIPMGDCPREMGGLTLLPGSYKSGYMPVRAAKGAGGGGSAAQLCPWESHWVEGDYETGDILTFHSMTVHKAHKSKMKDRLRLSLDVRYQSVNEPVEQGSLGLHFKEMTWEEVYRDWKTDELKYYWKDLPLKIASPWDAGYLTAGRRIC